MMTIDVRAACFQLAKDNLFQQMRPEEYWAISQTIIEKKPRSMLIFGCGRDSHLWKTLAPEGASILWVENQPRWVEKCPGPVLLTRYHFKTSDWRTADPLAAADFWPVLSQMHFDWCLVDGPYGGSDNGPGRLAPIAFASGLRGTIIVHDTHREAEAGLCAKYLAGRPSRTIHHLTIFE